MEDENERLMRRMREKEKQRAVERKETPPVEMEKIQSEEITPEQALSTRLFEVDKCGKIFNALKGVVTFLELREFIIETQRADLLQHMTKEKLIGEIVDVSNSELERALARGSNPAVVIPTLEVIPLLARQPGVKVEMKERKVDKDGFSRELMQLDFRGKILHYDVLYVETNEWYGKLNIGLRIRNHDEVQPMLDFLTLVDRSKPRFKYLPQTFNEVSVLAAFFQLHKLEYQKTGKYEIRKVTLHSSVFMDTPEQRVLELKAVQADLFDKIFKRLQRTHVYLPPSLASVYPMGVVAMVMKELDEAILKGEDIWTQRGMCFMPSEDILYSEMIDPMRYPKDMNSDERIEYIWTAMSAAQDEFNKKQQTAEVMMKTLNNLSALSSELSDTTSTMAPVCGGAQSRSLVSGKRQALMEIARVQQLYEIKPGVIVSDHMLKGEGLKLRMLKPNKSMFEAMSRAVKSHTGTVVYYPKHIAKMAERAPSKPADRQIRDEEVIKWFKGTPLVTRLIIHSDIPTTTYKGRQVFSYDLDVLNGLGVVVAHCSYGRMMTWILSKDKRAPFVDPQSELFVTRQFLETMGRIYSMEVALMFAQLGIGGTYVTRRMDDLRQNFHWISTPAEIVPGKEVAQTGLKSREVLGRAMQEYAQWGTTEIHDIASSEEEERKKKKGDGDGESDVY